MTGAMQRTSWQRFRTFLVLCSGLVAVGATQKAAAQVGLDARLHYGVLQVGSDGANYLRVRLDGQANLGTSGSRAGLNVVLVIDRSGSMRGEKLFNVCEAAAFVVDQLQTGDVLSVVTFASGAQVLLGAAPIENINRDWLKQRIRQLTADGGTDMVNGLARGMDHARAYARSERVNRVILLSDGKPNYRYGLVEMARSGLSRGIVLTTMGVGADYNDVLMAKLADVGNGHYYFIERPQDMAGIFSQELRDLMSVVAREGVVTLLPAPGTAIDDVYGWEYSRSGLEVIIPVGDLAGGRSAEILVRLRTVTAQPSERQSVARVRFAYHDVTHNRMSRSEIEVSQVVTYDRQRIQSAGDAQVGQKVLRVQAAQTKTEAMRLFEAGKRSEAQQTLARGMLQMKAMGAAAAPAPAAAAEAADLDQLNREMERQTSHSDAPGRTLQIRARKAARDAMR